MYKNFLLLHVAMRLVLTPVHSSHSVDFTEHLLQSFVMYSMQLYGADFAVHNVHASTHVVDDVQLYGSLENVSCFPYENHMRKLKKMLRKNNMPLHQIINRIAERETTRADKDALDVGSSDSLPQGAQQRASAFQLVCSRLQPVLSSQNSTVYSVAQC